MSQAGVWALVPAKGFDRGKSRLGGVLDDRERAGFARSLFQHVIQQLAATPELSGVSVLTDDEEVTWLARGSGFKVCPDPPGADLQTIVDRGLKDAQQVQGARAALVCMADLPYLRSDDLGRLVRALDHAEVAIVPDWERTGTNALCLAPPRRISTSFGHADSFQRHLSAARNAGARVETLTLAGICFDVDEPDDLRSYDRGAVAAHAEARTFAPPAGIRPGRGPAE